MGYEDVTIEDVKQLRKEIILGSLFTTDYRNTLGIERYAAHNFFDGYLDFLHDLMEKDGIKDWDFWREISSYDTDENLEEWFQCFEKCPLRKKKKKN